MILGAVFLLVITWSYFWGKKYVHTTPLLPTANAEITLSTPSTTVAVNEPFEITLGLDSSEFAVDAADFIVSYNEEYLRLADLREGDFFKTYPSKTASRGLIKLSGVAFFENNNLVIPKGKGTVALFRFTPVKTGNTTIRIDPQKTIIASGGKNILDTSKITDLEITVQ